MSMMANQGIFFHVYFLIDFLNSFGHDDWVNDDNDSMIGLANKTALIVPDSFISRLECAGFNLNLCHSWKLKLRACEITIGRDD